MRFRCVCTTWRTLISAPHFVTKHIKYDNERALNDNDIRVMFTMDPQSSISLSDLKTSKGAEFPIRRHAFPVRIDSNLSRVKFVGSCNGIICVHFGSEFVLWNPCTGEHNVLPNPIGFLRYFHIYGFGYDHVNDDYKIVVGSPDVLEAKVDIEPRVHVFSLKRGSWNTYSGPNKSYIKCKGKCVNGVRFSLAEEKFMEGMLLPSKFSRIFVSRDHLYVCMEEMDGRVMMMTEYGVQESWTEVNCIESCNSQELPDVIFFVRPVWILENGDILAWTGQGYFTVFVSVYKSKDKKFGNVFEVKGRHNREEATYRETLVSPVTGSFKDF